MGRPATGRSPTSTHFTHGVFTPPFHGWETVRLRSQRQEAAEQHSSHPLTPKQARICPSAQFQRTHSLPGQPPPEKTPVTRDVAQQTTGTCFQGSGTHLGSTIPRSSQPRSANSHCLSPNLPPSIDQPLCHDLTIWRLQGSRLAQQRPQDLLCLASAHTKPAC